MIPPVSFTATPLKVSVDMAAIPLVSLENMKLDEYINSFPRAAKPKKRVELAYKLGISEIYVRSMCNGNKRILEKWAVAIEKATDGNVTRQEICPHLYEQIE